MSGIKVFFGILQIGQRIIFFNGGIGDFAVWQNAVENHPPAGQLEKEPNKNFLIFEQSPKYGTQKRIFANICLDKHGKGAIMELVRNKCSKQQNDF